MNQQNKTTVLYHSDNDGFGAAYAAWTVLGDEANYIPVQYGQSTEGIIPLGTERLYILDFSFDKSTCFYLHQDYDLTILDHHKTAEAELKDLPCAHFDMTRSGAVMAWEYFRPGEPVPLLLQYVQDYDLWKFELPNSKKVNLWASTLEWEFALWDSIAKADNFIREDAPILGNYIARFRDNQVNVAIKQARMMRLGAHSVPVVNASTNISEIGNKLCEEYPDAPYSASYCDRQDCRTWSLRSIGDFDVSAIAKVMGGGGHKNAAGFTTPLNWPEYLSPEQEMAFLERAKELDNKEVEKFGQGKGFTKDPVFYLEAGDYDTKEGWYFWDETGANSHGPFLDEDDCRAELKVYCDALDAKHKASLK